MHRGGLGRKGRLMADEYWFGGAFRTTQKVVVLGQGSVPKARVDRDGHPKLSKSGKPTFSTGTAALVHDEAGEFVPARGTISVHVTEPGDRYGQNAVRSTVYVTDGETWVTPYVANGYSAYSITAERLVEYKRVEAAK